jgi:hypothetical protein
MAEKVFDRETLLDLTVNVIPLAILAIFFVLYLVITPWGLSSVLSTLQLAIIGTMFLGLFVLTYYSGKAISKAEKAAEAEAELEAGTEPAELADASDAELEAEPDESGTDEE